MPGLARRRRTGVRAPLGVALAAVLLLCLAGCGARPSAGPDRDGQRGPADVWVPVADAPLAPREFANLVWTGREVVAFGGDTTPCPPTASCIPPTEPPPSDAAAYNPSTGTWRRIADTPVDARYGQAVAAGGRVYALGFPSDGVWREKDRWPRFESYDPDRDDWEQLPSPPGRPWTLVTVGDRVVAAHSSVRGDEGENNTQDSIYDPRSGDWTRLPPSPLDGDTVGTGRTTDRKVVAVAGRLVVIDAAKQAGSDRVGPYVYRAAVYDLDSGRWTRLPDSRIADSDPTWLVVGRQVINPTGGGGDTGAFADLPVSGLLDLRGDPDSWTDDGGPWRPLPEPTGETLTDSRYTGAPGVGAIAGSGLVLSGAFVLDVAAQAWSRLPANGRFANVQGASTVWAGDRLFVWGGTRFGDGHHQRGHLLGTGWTWRPSSDRVTTRGEQAGTDSPSRAARGPGQELIGRGMVLEDASHGPQLCLGGVRSSLPPQCGGPDIPNWDWHRVGTDTTRSHTTYGSYVVVGTYHPGRSTFTLTRDPVPVDQYRGPSLTYEPVDPVLGTPCPEPAGGWRVLDPATTTDDALQKTAARAARMSGYTGLWVDQSRSTDPESNDPTRLVLNVAFTGDADARAEREEALRDTWGGALCVSHAPRTETELSRVQADLRRHPGLLFSGGDVTGQRVSVTVIYDDGRWQRELDDTYGPGVVAVTTALRPYTGQLDPAEK